MSSASLAAPERPRAGPSNTVFKSGPLFISSKGIGWKSWKKRWFILTRTSLVFFKNDPSALPQRGGEVNLTLGGIDLNNTGSVVVREDKKLLTVLFPDGRDGRAFTLKAETSEDLYEWKTALEHALSQAPSAALVIGHNRVFQSDTNEAVEGSFHQWRDKHPVKSMVVGRPILLALEDIDGGPSFLEKALRFLEKFGTKVEGILRQSADVEEVDRRVQEYEQGKTEFESDEDAHVVGDCVKHVLRELPSSPVPASCCTALLEAYKIDRKEARINAMRSAIVETFPEPNRRLLQRILKMMHAISSHAHENRMNPSAVAACMAPLLLRPLLAGECELEDDFDVNGDNSAQLLAAANAANNAQAIITTLLEEYENIFDDENLHRCSISADSQIENSASDDSSDDENMDMKDNGYHDAENEVDQDTDNDPERALSGKLSETSGSASSDLYDYKAFGGDDSDIGSPRTNNAPAETSNIYVDPVRMRDSNAQLIGKQRKPKKGNENSTSEMDASSVLPIGESYQSMGEILSSADPVSPILISGLESSAEKSAGKVSASNLNGKRSTFWGRSNARKTPSMESVDSSAEEEFAIQRLEIAKNDLRHRIAKEARGNAILQASLERRKQALHERRLALEQDVARLQEQLQAERDLRAALEVGLSMSSGQFSNSRGMDSKTRAELEEIALAEADVTRLKQKVAELHHQLNQQRQHHYGSLSDASDCYQHVQNHNPQQRFLQQDFDTTLAFVNHERKQRTEEGLLGTDRRLLKGPGLATGSSSRQHPRNQFMESASISDSKSTEASTNMSMDELCGIDSAPSTSRAVEVMDYPRHPSAASSALVELTTRLDFFKERRSQLMEQLHNLDLNYGTTSSQDFIYRPSSPPWN
ncbi:rho GTPase-activating protein 7-like isoform X1 [Populus alba x Populus x berolinensis]|nr:rho GTPase-activating protein 7-like isoform X1 [Populus alba x Populus x berolinensis]